MTATVWKETKCPATDGWLNKEMWGVLTTEWYSMTAQNEILTHAATGTELENCAT